MIVVLHVSQTNRTNKRTKIYCNYLSHFKIVALCWFTLRSYAIEVIPASYAWSTFTGPVSGQVHEVKPWSPSSPASSYSEFEGANEESNHYGPDYVVMYSLFYFIPIQYEYVRLPTGI